MNWTMRTDDEGYFQRAFLDVLKNEKNSFWKDYDVFVAICCTTGVTGIIWVIIGIFELTKFIECRWELASCGFLISLINLLLFAGGNIFIILRICIFSNLTKLLKINLWRIQNGFGIHANVVNLRKNILSLRSVMLILAT